MHCPCQRNCSAYEPCPGDLGFDCDRHGAQTCCFGSASPSPHRPCQRERRDCDSYVPCAKGIGDALFGGECCLGSSVFDICQISSRVYVARGVAALLALLMVSVLFCSVRICMKRRREAQDILARSIASSISMLLLLGEGGQGESSETLSAPGGLGTT